MRELADLPVPFGRRGGRRSRPLAALAVAFAAMLVGGLTPALAQSAPRVDEQAEAGFVAGAPPWRPGLHPFSILVDGEPTTGLLAVPEGAPRSLAVLVHGWGQDAAGYTDDLRFLAGEGALAAAIDIRGAQDAYKPSAGVADAVAVTLALQRHVPDGAPIVVAGSSMGGGIALLTPLAAPPGTYSGVVAGAPVTDLGTLWNETPWIRPWLEAETGGDPESVPDAYARLSPARHGARFAASAVGHVVLVHGADDDIVPPAHSDRMLAALAAAGQPASLSLLLNDPGPPCAGAACPASTAPAGHAAGRMELLRPFVAELLVGPPAEPRVDPTPEEEPASLMAVRLLAGAWRPSASAT